MPESSDIYKELLENLYDGVYFVDRDRRITYWNKGAQRISGYSSERVVGVRCADNLLVHINEAGTVLCTKGCPLHATICDGKPREAEAYLKHADGHRVPVLMRVTPLRDPQGNIIGGVETFSDNSAMLSTRNRVTQLQEITLHDALTGVGNRRYIEMKGASCLGEFQSHGVPFGVLFFDIDHFKQFNDTYGHDVGDKVLKIVSQTLLHGLGSTDFLGRFGGEEFVALVVNVHAEELKAVAEKLRVMVAASHLTTEQGDIRVTISIGATLAREGDQLETLFKRADDLLYQSKNNGRNRVTCEG